MISLGNGGLPLGNSKDSDFRQTLLIIAKECALAPLSPARFHIQDKEDTSGFVIDAQSCKQQPDGMPLIEITGSQAEVWKEHSIRIITADQQEQQQIRNHLAENRAKLSLEYIKARIEQFRSQGLTEFTPSYITTVVPPRDNWHSKSMPKRLCAVCEQKAGKTCVKCKSAHYCSKEHQVCGVPTVSVTAFLKAAVVMSDQTMQA
eukprot:13650-Heterococcus_DN1.PRE.1